jgi:hypothetical protein
MPIVALIMPKKSFATLAPNGNVIQLFGVIITIIGVKIIGKMTIGV